MALSCKNILPFINNFSSQVNNRVSNGSLALREMFAEQMVRRLNLLSFVQTNRFRTHSEHFCKFLAR
ncbi:unnamed protein product [Acanthoscelides obtectus]|uniref:Uncharacterized protein n=1 Tax=Acanthoscelides obtectus TaxID=200917 RepID=A0A9P0L877_ACAOB|nr:unnamed protein product [Acanthoscelides obtectus]CAK1620524.1 hypothetical protein AOBTE_LOCUS422 [Acanthoscelides obtectus]